jgi:hypothetical protein
MKTYGGSQIATELDGGEKSASRPARFISVEIDFWKRKRKAIPVTGLEGP